jgi:hypothetical protein
VKKAKARPKYNQNTLFFVPKTTHGRQVFSFSDIPYRISSRSLRIVFTK